MKCAQCDSALVKRSKFCPDCGAPVRAVAIRGGPKEQSASGAKGEAIKHYITDVATEAGQLSKSALKSDLGKKMAAGAALGAVLAVPVPFVGPAVGAFVGAGIVAFRRFTRD